MANIINGIVHGALVVGKVAIAGVVAVAGANVVGFGVDKAADDIAVATNQYAPKVTNVKTNKGKFWKKNAEVTVTTRDPYFKGVHYNTTYAVPKKAFRKEGK